MARPTHIQAADPSQYALVREKSGAPPAADTTDLTNAIFDVELAHNWRDFETVFVGCEFPGASGTPSAAVEILYYSEEGAPVWRRVVESGSPVTTPMLEAGQDAEVRCGASKVFVRIHEVADMTGVTAIRILARGGKRRIR